MPSRVQNTEQWDRIYSTKLDPIKCKPTFHIDILFYRFYFNEHCSWGFQISGLVCTFFSSCFQPYNVPINRFNITTKLPFSNSFLIMVYSIFDQNKLTFKIEVSVIIKNEMVERNNSSPPNRQLLP